MKTEKYQICTKTVMDTSDPDIFFDSKGICNHYYTANQLLDYFKNIDRKKTLEDMISKVKNNKNSYDCIIR